MERRKRRREWDERVTRMDAEGLVRILKDNIPAGRRSPGRPKRILKQVESPSTKQKR